MSHNQSNTSQGTIIDDSYSMIPAAIPQSKEEEETQAYLDDGWYEPTKLKNEAHRVKEVFRHKFSQQSNKFKKGAHITLEMEKMIRKEAYQIFFDTIDQNFDGRMELKEVAVVEAMR